MSKVSDEQFVQALVDSFGNYSKTARYIVEKFGVESYTRQAVKDRVNNNKELYESYFDDVKNKLVAESIRTLQDSLNSEDDRIKLDTAKYITSRLAKDLGFTERQEITGEDGAAVFIIKESI